MPDEFLTQTPLPTKRRGGAGQVLVAVLVAFVFGAGVVAASVWQGWLPLPMQPGAGQRIVGLPAASPTPITAAPPAPAPAVTPAPVTAAVARQDSLEVRLDGLETRLARLDLQAEAASGNAARAEGLLVAFAARRALDRGAPLGYLEDQLRLRFANAQPNAVTTVIEAARAPVTLDGLVSGLDALAPTLSAVPASESPLARARRELAGLFVIRHDSTPSPAPESRLERARLALIAGRTDDAVAEIERLPGANRAADWVAQAKRYGAARRALDLIETTAMLETRTLNDGAGARVEQPSPLTGGAQ